MKRILSNTIFHLFILVILTAGIETALLKWCMKPVKKMYNVEFLNIESIRVDSMLSCMTLEQKIGSLLFIEAQFIDSSEAIVLNNWIAIHQPAGVIFKTDSAGKYVRYKYMFNNSASIPLFFGLNTDNGYPGYFADFLSFPSGVLMDAIADDSLLTAYSEMVAAQAGSLGIQFMIFPAFSNIKDLVYGYDRYYADQVTLKSLNYFRALKKDSIFACLHGFDYSNIHKNDEAVLRTLQHYDPLIKQGIPCILLDHDPIVLHPSPKDSGQVDPVHFSEYMIEKTGFEGLLIRYFATDADDDQLFSLLSGNTDLLICRDDPQKIITGIRSMAESGKLDIETIDNKVRRVLQAKIWAGLKKDTVATECRPEKFNKTIANTALSKSLFKASLTLVKDRDSLIPFNALDTNYVAVVVGKQDLPYFREHIGNYLNMKTFFLNTTNKNTETLLKSIDSRSVLILALNQPGPDTSFFRLLTDRIIQLHENIRIAVVHFGSLETLKYLGEVPVLVQVYDNSSEGQKMASELLFGGISAQGALPFNISDSLKAGMGVRTEVTRLQYTIPEEAGISSDCILKIDSIILEGISKHAFPGCQVFIAKDGKVIYNKGFGHHTYDGDTKVGLYDLYDVASVTKVAATTLAAMKLISDGRMNLDDPLEKFFKDTKIEYTRIKPDTIIYLDTLLLKEVKNIDKLLKRRDTLHLNDSVIIAYDTVIYQVTPKLNIFKRRVRELLAHLSGLPPAMPVLRYILWNQDTILRFSDSLIYSEHPDSVLTRRDSLKYLFGRYFTQEFLKDSSERQVADNMYMRKQFVDTLWIDTKQIRVYDKSVYMYSDVNMIILQQAIDSLNKCPIDKFLEREIYVPLGLQTACFLPLKHVPKNRIAPTTDEKVFRRQLLHGYVHDESAALMGGIAGNAGLFSNAHDLGIICQMLLNGGIYGGKRYITENIVRTFTATQTDIYRGLGFDKKGEGNIIADSASPNSYGHTGFTGTCIWVDPDIDLVYVFLSNRVHPKVNNWQINTLKIRQRIHQAIYDDINTNSSAGSL
ncbi:MAG: serine hydrolase [Bacteroidetes bacterium]|nr:serine hydrolase [Bacteroidota bacterium]